MEHPNLIHNNYLVLLSKLLSVKEYRNLEYFEEFLYEQLLVTTQRRAHLEALLLKEAIRKQENGEGPDTSSGGTAQQSPEAEEHRDDDPPPPV